MVEIPNKLVIIVSVFSTDTYSCYYSYYYYHFGVRCARPGESEDTLSVQRPQPHTTNTWKEEKHKTVGDKKEKADHAKRKALALFLKQASPTLSNTWSLRSFRREGHKASAILRSPTTRRRERVPMSNQGTTSNTSRHIRQRQCTA